jgi:hypothetical protein
MPDKICFVIAPIGDEGSKIRSRSDQVLKHILTPVAKEFGYEVIRADKISQPGIITSQIIQHLIEDPLVIADLSGQNPNVFYELAIRHAVKKPFIQMMQAGESIPFDVAVTRVIPFDISDLDSVEQCKIDLKKQIDVIEKNSTHVETPLSITFDIMALRQSEKPTDKIFSEFLSLIREQLKIHGEMLLNILEKIQRIEYLQRPYAPEDTLLHGLLGSTSMKATSDSSAIDDRKLRSIIFKAIEEEKESTDKNKSSE